MSDPGPSDIIYLETVENRATALGLRSRLAALSLESCNDGCETTRSGVITSTGSVCGFGRSSIVGRRGIVGGRGIISRRGIGGACSICGGGIGSTSGISCGGISSASSVGCSRVCSGASSVGRGRVRGGASTGGGSSSSLGLGGGSSFLGSSLGTLRSLGALAGLASLASGSSSGSGLLGDCYGDSGNGASSGRVVDRGRCGVIACGDGRVVDGRHSRVVDRRGSSGVVGCSGAGKSASEGTVSARVVGHGSGGHIRLLACHQRRIHAVGGRDGGARERDNEGEDGEVEQHRGKRVG
ncbi:hypothetical protein B0H14DRAFT_2767060 [Mycena olivaceomarginata]|nr:hypothetical protein B0H14DRAFT_2767060 [Mycena olivaceomarginata]